MKTILSLLFITLVDKIYSFAKSFRTWNRFESIGYFRQRSPSSLLHDLLRERNRS